MVRYPPTPTAAASRPATPGCGASSSSWRRGGRPAGGGRAARVRERHGRLVLVGEHGHPRHGVGIAVVEGRPSVWIGHTVLTVGDVDRSADYWQRLGMREIERNEDVAVLELRGGTHLLLLPGATH